MAYKYEDLEKQSVAAINKHGLIFIADIIAYLPCAHSTFYEKNLEKSDAIKKALTEVKTKLKVSMRSKWYKSDAPALQMGLMKLLSTDDEIKKLSMNTNVIEGGAKPVQTIVHLGSGIDPNGTTT